MNEQDSGNYHSKVISKVIEKYDTETMTVVEIAKIVNHRLPAGDNVSRKAVYNLLRRQGVKFKKEIPKNNRRKRKNDGSKANLLRGRHNGFV